MSLLATFTGPQSVMDSHAAAAVTYTLPPEAFYTKARAISRIPKSVKKFHKHWQTALPLYLEIAETAITVFRQRNGIVWLCIKM